jgi:hypothetical protein
VTWRKVVFAADCVDEFGDGEVLICPRCGVSYADCPCPGPHQEDEFEYEERPDGLWARIKEPAP